MRNSISYPALAAALGLALVAGTPAKAQTVITRDAAGQPVETVITQQPVRTVTTETVRTVHPSGRLRDHRVVTTTRRTVQTSIPAQPLYDVVAPPAAAAWPAPAVGPAPAVAPAPAYTGYGPPLYNTYGPRLYDTVSAPTVDDTVVNAAVAPLVPTVPAYRYVYEPDRILVIDPVTNIAVQSIPR
jgi:hypothetical protein